MSFVNANAGLLLVAALLVFLIILVYGRAKQKRGVFLELFLLGLLGLFSFQSAGPTRNSLYIGPILFTSEQPSSFLRLMSGGTKMFGIENRGKETLLTSVSAISDSAISRFEIFEGEEYLKESEDKANERTLSFAIPPSKRVSIRTSEEVSLEPRDVHALQFGVHGYYSSRHSDLPPIRLK